MDIRGSALFHTRVFLTSRLGKEAFTFLTQKLSRSTRDVLTSPGIVLHGWYPVSAWNDVLDHLSRWPSRSGAGLIRGLAGYVAAEDLTTAHKVLLKLATPGLVMRQAGTFWSRYFNGGNLASFPEGERRFRAVLNLGTDAHLDPSPITCREAVPAWQEKAIGLAGAIAGRSVQVKCRFEGHPRCEFEVTWDRAIVEQRRPYSNVEQRGAT